MWDELLFLLVIIPLITVIIDTHCQIARRAGERRLTCFPIALGILTGHECVYARSQ